MNSETPKKIEAVVFDLDGTLLDTLEDLAASMNRVLESKKFPSHPVESYLHFIGDGARMLAQRVLPEQERSESQINNIHQAFEKDYRDNWGFHTGDERKPGRQNKKLIGKHPIQPDCTF